MRRDSRTISTGSTFLESCRPSQQKSWIRSKVLPTPALCTRQRPIVDNSSSSSRGLILDSIDSTESTHKPVKTDSWRSVLTLTRKFARNAERFVASRFVTMFWNSHGPTSTIAISHFRYLRSNQSQRSDSPKRTKRRTNHDDRLAWNEITFWRISSKEINRDDLFFFSKVIR